MQRPVYYLGPEGTHSHQAALGWMGEDSVAVPCRSLYEIFEKTLAAPPELRAAGLAPVENSCEGPVAQTLDLLAENPEATIYAGFSCRIHQNLLVAPGVWDPGKIARVYSHPQALGQCRATLQRLCPDAELMPATSTAAAAEIAAREPGAAAVASLAAARRCGLAVLRRNIQDSKENATRFYAISRRRGDSVFSDCEAAGAGEPRSLMYLVAGNRPGALVHLLAPFESVGVNLTSIQSRPLPGKPWQYAFFIEAATDWGDAPAAAAWALAMALAESGRIIGTYRNAGK